MTRGQDTPQAPSPAPHEPARGTRQRLFKKRISEDAPVTTRSVALFRFGEQCNYRCPMCSNTGDPSVFFQSTEELLRRAAFLHRRNFRRVVVTGGEATIHPGFWRVVEQLAEYGMLWDVNTHGRTFARPGFARRAVATGLRRAIVSLHSFHAPTSAAMFGVDERAHHGTVEGIERLLEAGARVMLNCVLSRLNLDQLEAYVQIGHERFGGRAVFKFVFPSTLGKGGAWSEIATLRYGDVREPIGRMRDLAARLGARVCFEAFPSCILHEPNGFSYGRSAFGESHYLDDASGDRVYRMRHVEAELSVYGEACRRCVALRRCAGVARAYATRYGVDELTPFLSTSPPDDAPRTANPTEVPHGS